MKSRLITSVTYHSRVNVATTLCEVDYNQFATIRTFLDFPNFIIRKNIEKKVQENQSFLVA